MQVREVGTVEYRQDDFKTSRALSSAHLTSSPSALEMHVRPSCKHACAGHDRQRAAATCAEADCAYGTEDEHQEIHAPDEEAQPKNAIRTLATAAEEEVAEHCENGHIPC